LAIRLAILGDSNDGVWRSQSPGESPRVATGIANRADMVRQLRLSLFGASVEACVPVPDFPKQARGLVSSLLVKRKTTARREADREKPPPKQRLLMIVPVTTQVPDDIRRVIQKRLDVAEDRVTLDASFREDLGADSLALMDLSLAIEEAFDIDIPEEEADKIRTVRDAVDYIETQVRARGSS
jgi:acyl carrier protein